MALAEARAAWQRTANRFIVQEDAKRAPRLAPFSSTTVCNNKPTVDSGPTGDPNGEGNTIPNTFSSLFELNPSCPNFSPNTRWWLQLQPSYGCHKVDENPNIGSFEACKTQETSLDYESLFGDGKVKNEADNDRCFDSEPSLMGLGKHVPWWRTAGTEELASLVAQTSIDLFENCDLPSPRNGRAVKDFNYGRDRDIRAVNQNFLDMNACTPMKSVGNSYKRLRVAVGNQAYCASDQSKPLSPRKPEKGKLEVERGNAKLLEALRHSQTRAREAEKVARQASAEKEHVIKLVLRQASEMFAYKQLIQLLQLENMYLSYISSATQSLSKALPVVLPLKRQKKRQTKCSFEKELEDCCSWVEPVVFALGVGLICAGFLLGWSVGWILPKW